MILNVTCPHCGALLDVAPAWLGQPMECGGCGSVFTCPEIAEEAPPDDAPQVLSERPTRRRRESRREREERWAEYDEYQQEDDPDSYVAQKRGPGYATASLVLGILAIIIGSIFSLFCCGFVQTIMAVIGMILGYFGLRSEAKTTAIAGMVLNVLSAVISVLFMSFIGIWLSTNPFGPPPPPPPTAATTATWKANNPPPPPAPNKAKL